VSGAYVARRPAARSFARAQLRAKSLFYLFAVLALALAGRLAFLQIHDYRFLSQRARDQQLMTMRVAAERGSILDRDGNTIVRSLPAVSIYATRREIGDPGAVARALGPLLGRSPNWILARLAAGGDKVPIERKIPEERGQDVAHLNLSGISIESEPTGVRFLPSGRLASTVIGFTGMEENGLGGIESAYDAVLLGAAGTRAVEIDEFGRPLPFGRRYDVVAPRTGRSIELTLDSSLQYDVQRILAETVAKYRARSGTALVMDPATGDLLAVANAPDYDVADWERSSDDARRDRAAEDAYEPGSTFKLITASAAIDSGKVTTSDRFAARDQLAIGGNVIHNAEDGFLAGTGGTESLEDIVAYSHNVGAAEVGLSIGRTTLYRMIRRFGFGDSTHSGLPGESPGILPALADWSATSLPTISFGHGIATTPLAMARAYCAFANGGLLMRPRVVSAILSRSGEVVKRFPPVVERRVISRATAKLMRRFLRAVVVRGTGRGVAEVAGYTTAGKTGTAQVAENGGYLPGAYVASFIGMIPADRPRFVILVKVERPVGAIYGGVVAAPAFARIARIAMIDAGILPELPAPAPRPARRRGTSKGRL